jgi:hypothetical protein
MGERERERERDAYNQKRKLQRKGPHKYQPSWIKSG